MSKNFVQSAALRFVAMGAYRTLARMQVWRFGPRIFVNSIPKAGTHLLTAELEKFACLQASRLHIETRKVNSLAKHQERREDVVIDLPKFARYVGTVRPGQFFSAHLFWDPALLSYLTSTGIKSIFMVRDPRDILLSNLHYIKGLRRHFLHRLFTTELQTDEERIRVLIQGRSGVPFVRSLKDTLNLFLPWRASTGVLTIRFEDLVGSSGGGSDERKLLALRQVAEHCALSGDVVKDIAGRSLQSRSTPTLRKGKIAGWRTELSDAQLELLETECGAAMRQLGCDTA